jgi:phage gp29-like protein
MKFTDRVRAFLGYGDGGTSMTADSDTVDLAATGRPRAIEGESMVLGNDLLASMTRVRDGGIYFLPTDEIIRRKGWAVYKEMLNDDQVKACLEFKKILIGGRAFEVAPLDDSAEAKQQAAFVEEAFKRIKVDQALKEALSALEFGFSLAEQVFTRDTWEGTQYVFLSKLAFREPSQIYIKADEHGNVLGAQQYNTNAQGIGKNTIDLPKEKIFLFTHNKRFGNNYGVSDLRSAYRPWWAKKFIVQFWNVFLERMGSPMTTMKYPQGASEELKRTLKQIMRGLSSKTEILIPEGVEIALVEATRGGTATYEQALAFHNDSIARAILMSGLLGMNGDAARSSGTNGQSFIQQRLIFKMADGVSQELADALMNQVINPLLALNFAKVLAPKFIWQDYGQFEGQVVADEIRQLHAAGVIDMDQKDVNYVRSIMGLPIRTAEETPDEVIRPAPTPPPGGGAANAPPSAPQGNDRAGKGGAGKQNGGDATKEKKFALVLEEVTEV